MPELPDITVYVEALGRHVEGHRLERVRVSSPFVVRTVDPSLDSFSGKILETVGRLGKRIVLGFEDHLHLVIHLMIAGRLRWRPKGAKVPGRRGLAAFDFDNGSLLFTEASSKHRASLHAVRGRTGLAAFDMGGVEPLEAGIPDFAAALTRDNHTLKRALTDPRIVSGIGNAYSDEILHRARLSPVALTSSLGDEDIRRLHAAMAAVLMEWTQKLRDDVGEGFPDKITAFHGDMAVHGRFGKPCPVCGSPVQRIVRAENEVNYCATCQTGGKVLADRALSRLLGKDWPRTIEELETRLARR